MKKFIAFCFLFLAGQQPLLTSAVLPLDGTALAAEDTRTPATPREEALADFPGSKVFVPGRVPAPAIILLHGSEGGRAGYIEDLAKSLRDAGFVTMSLCYFDCPGLPSKLTNIPLDRVLQAADVLRRLPTVQNKKVGIFGWSRGAEQSVIIASLAQATTKLAAVAVHAPHHAIVSSWDPDAQTCVRATVSGRAVCAPAWTWRGKVMGGGEDFDGPFRAGPVIEIEKYQGPLYLSHGTADELWPVDESKQLEARRKNVPQLPTETHYWPGEGHVIDEQVNVDRFSQTLTDFFKRHLL